MPPLYLLYHRLPISYHQLLRKRVFFYAAIRKCLKFKHTRGILAFGLGFHIQIRIGFWIGIGFGFRPQVAASCRGLPRVCNSLQRIAAACRGLLQIAAKRLALSKIIRLQAAVKNYKQRQYLKGITPPASIILPSCIIFKTTRMNYHLCV